MHNLSIPIPVALFIKRLFNVFSSITISNQYFLLQKADPDAGREARSKNEAFSVSEKSPARIEVSALWGMLRVDEKNGTNTMAYTHWGRLKPWLWSTPVVQSAPCNVHTISVDETKKSRSFEEDSNIDEKSTPQTNPPPKRPSSRPPRTPSRETPSPIQTLMLNPTLFDPIRTPRNPIVLCHGLYGYDVRGPSSFPLLQLHYWAKVLNVLKKKIGAEVIVTAVPGTGSIESRAQRLDEYLRENARGRDINFVAHSMGGLDCRHLITHAKPKEYNPASLTTICTPHRGSAFMDWCTENIGIGKLQREAKEASRKAPEVMKSSPGFSLTNLPSSLTTMLLSLFDSPAYANLTTHYLQNVFNPATPDDPRVRYYSIAARTNSMSVLHALWLPKMVLDGVEAREREMHPHPEQEEWGHDGLVSVRSARWGEFLGTLEGCDHWDVRGGPGIGEWNLDHAVLSSLKNSLSDPLSNVNVNINWKDWTRIIGAWRKEEEQREKRECKSPSTEKGSTRDLPATNNPDAEDAVLKSSTDKLSAVFDWVAEQVPRTPQKSNVTAPSLSDTQPSPPPSAFGSPSARKIEEERVDAKKASEAGDERLKFDLERFYVALSRKLYDDGL